MKSRMMLVFFLALAVSLTAWAGGDGKSCHHEKSKDVTTAASCPVKSKTVTETSEVKLTGNVLCMSCDLKKEAECRKVFQVAGNDQPRYDICPMTAKLADIETMSDHGKATLSIAGKLMKCEDGTTMLMIDTFEKAAKPVA